MREAREGEVVTDASLVGSLRVAGQGRGGTPACRRPVTYEVRVGSAIAHATVACGEISIGRSRGGTTSPKAPPICRKNFGVWVRDGLARPGRIEDIAEGIDWVEGDLGTWTPPPRGFDLVGCLYVHVPGSVGEMLTRLGSGVAPGGTLFLVGHLPVDAATGGPSPAAGQVQVTVDAGQVGAGFAETDRDAARRGSVSRAE
jgi:hypothetical protein